MARSALSAFLPPIDGRPVGSHQDVCRLVKGVFQKRPLLPKHWDTWDVGVVLQRLLGRAALTRIVGFPGPGSFSLASSASGLSPTLGPSPPWMAGCGFAGPALLCNAS